MGDRIEIVRQDVPQRIDLLQKADVVLLNNPFTFFCSLEEQQKQWDNLRKHIKKGAYIVATPSLDEQLEAAQVALLFLSFRPLLC